ncbi:MAG: hypothetical protein R3C49_00290 [Planctomycetaceae bacterium]
MKSGDLQSETGGPVVDRASAVQWLIGGVVGLISAFGTWWPLLTGAGLVGGDVYPYFFPQKVVLADALAAGELPFWNRLTGLGYPMLAESQAGVFYPPNQILYRLLDVHTAFHLSIVLHYWLAFVFTFRFALSQQLKTLPALFASLVFVYGWFPARISLEWSITGGVFFPLILWLTDRVLIRPTLRRLAVLVLVHAVFLLSGHFTLAFITQLTSIVYAFLKTRRFKPAALTTLAVLLSLLLAAVQLLPTLELRQLSQRSDGTSRAFDPAFGHLPPVYLTQVAASWWYWHSPAKVIGGAVKQTPGAISADTNAVEAHLYWGLIPLLFIVLSFVPRIRRKLPTAVTTVWLWLMLLAAVYATGWLMPVTKHLPGFSFFNGPGRYSIVCALAGALISGLVLQTLLSSASRTAAGLVVGGLSLITWVDLHWSSTAVADAQVTRRPPYRALADSWIRQRLNSDDGLQYRLLAPGPNIANLYGISSVPEYLGLGPAVYYDDTAWPATGPDSPDDEFPSTEQLQQMRRLGVTHLLMPDGIQHPADHVELMGRFPDTFLNAVWGRGLQPCSLYRIEPQPAQIESDPADALEGSQITAIHNSEVQFEVQLQQPATIHLKELMYPGWTVTVDGRPVVPVSPSLMRTVEVSQGTHTVRWSFVPTQFSTGLIISVSGCVIITLLIVAGKNINVISPGEDHAHI